MEETPQPPTLQTPTLQYKLETTFEADRVVHSVDTNHVETWMTVEVLGEGGQGTVYLERSETDSQLRAVKKVSQRLMKTHGLNIKRELHALIANEDLFVRFLGWYEDTAQNIYIAMEYVPHGDLYQYTQIHGHETKQVARSITKQLLSGLTILHQKQICHRDLKPQNILIARLSPIQVKLADFGISKCTIGTDLRTQYGTTGYMAPEIQEILPPGLRPRSKYTNAVDMWALGILVYEILALQNPFQLCLADDLTPESEYSGVAPRAGPPPVDTHLLYQFCKGKRELPIESLRESQTTESAIDFIKALIVADPRSRMSAADALNHRWFVSSESSPVNGIDEQKSLE